MQKKSSIKLELPTGVVYTGPGTVPTSTASIGTSSIQKIVTDLRIISNSGTFSSGSSK